jgi:hypothetical protein
MGGTDAANWSTSLRHFATLFRRSSSAAYFQ